MPAKKQVEIKAVVKTALSPKKEETPKNWFKQGKDVFDAKRHIDSLAKSRKERSVSRFFLKAGEDAIIVFTDSSPLNLGA